MSVALNQTNAVKGLSLHEFFHKVQRAKVYGLQLQVRSRKTRIIWPRKGVTRQRSVPSPKAPRWGRGRAPKHQDVMQSKTASFRFFDSAKNSQAENTVQSKVDAIYRQAFPNYAIRNYFFSINRKSNVYRHVLYPIIRCNISLKLCKNWFQCTWCLQGEWSGETYLTSCMLKTIHAYFSMGCYIE